MEIHPQAAEASNEPRMMPEIYVFCCCLGFPNKIPFSHINYEDSHLLMKASDKYFNEESHFKCLVLDHKGKEPAALCVNDLQTCSLRLCVIFNLSAECHASVH